MLCAAARARMTLRALVERDPTQQPGASADPYGNPTVPEAFATLATIPCWAWSSSRTEQTTTARTIVVEELRIMLPRDSAVTELDRVRKITDRAGRTKLGFEGPFNLRSLREKDGFLHGTLEGVSS
jgi:hypothetical protein